MLVKMPKKGEFVLADSAFMRSERAGLVMARGCEAQLGGQCGRLAVAVVVDGGSPAAVAAGWQLHAVCGACARALGIELLGDEGEGAA